MGRQRLASMLARAHATPSMLDSKTPRLELGVGSRLAVAGRRLRSIPAQESSNLAKIFVLLVLGHVELKEHLLLGVRD